MKRKWDVVSGSGWTGLATEQDNHDIQDKQDETKTGCCIGSGWRGLATEQDNHDIQDKQDETKMRY